METEKTNEFNPLLDTSVSILPKVGQRAKNQYGVTDLQEEFARLVAETGTLTEAYIRVYYLGQGKPVKGKPETIHSMAFRVSKRPRVADRIAYYQSQKIARTNEVIQARHNEYMKAATANELTNEQIRSFIRDRLFTLAKSELPAMATLKSLELLGKLAGIAAFEKVAENEKDKTEVEAKAKLKELIDHLRSQGKLAKVVNGEASSLPIAPKPLESLDS